VARILFFNMPASGHVNPSLPVVRELVRRGHQISYYCTDDFRAPIEKTGVDYRPYPSPGPSVQRLVDAATDYPPLELILMEYSNEYAPFCIAEVEREKPDLVMYDSLVPWGWIAAKVTGTPSVSSMAGFAIENGKFPLTLSDGARIARSALKTMRARGKQRNRLTSTYDTLTFPTPFIPGTADLNIRFVAPEFQAGFPEFNKDLFVLVGPPIDPPEPSGEQWKSPTSGRPLVYVSLGTVYNKDPAFFREIFAACADYPADFLLSTGHGVSISELGTIPDNFDVRDYVPQFEVLSQADAFITHGGMNSVQEGLYCGVPEVLVPQQLEQVITGRQVAAKGAGIVLADKTPYGRVTADELRAALEQLLDDPSYTQQAQLLSEAAKAAGGVQRAADEVERVLGGLPPKAP
jgi:MGT family glycosyltransferase